MNTGTVSKGTRGAPVRDEVECIQTPYLSGTRTHTKMAVHKTPKAVRNCALTL